jgi:hypothetical protein
LSLYLPFQRFPYSTSSFVQSLSVTSTDSLLGLPYLKLESWGRRERVRESNKGGQYDQSTEHSQLGCHQETPLNYEYGTKIEGQDCKMGSVRG